MTVNTLSNNTTGTAETSKNGFFSRHLNCVPWQLHGRCNWGWWISAPTWSLQLKNPEFLYEDHGGWCNRCTTVKSNNTSTKTELTDLRSTKSDQFLENKVKCEVHGFLAICLLAICTLASAFSGNILAWKMHCRKYDQYSVIFNQSYH